MLFDKNLSNSSFLPLSRYVLLPLLLSIGSLILNKWSLSRVFCSPLKGDSEGSEEKLVVFTLGIHVLL